MKKLVRTHNYRPDVDGLRGIAVLFVLLFHTYPAQFPGGYIGVDIFFVISGFVITLGIKSSVNKGLFSHYEFILRRAFRILPLLFAVIGATFPFAWYIMQPSEFGAFSTSAISALLFVSNIFFAATDPYLVETIKNSPLMHTWSLGVEVQFYLIFPFLIVFALKKSVHLAIRNVILMCLFSFAFSVFLTFLAKDISFYLPLSRFWEFGIGALVALREEAPTNKINSKIIEISSLISILVLFCSLLYFDNSVHHPSFLTLFPVMSVALLICFGKSSKIVETLLTSRPIVFTGIISYSIYLLHQPIFTFLRIYFYDVEALQTMVFGFGLLFTLSVLSWYFIEQPFRHRNKIGFLKNSVIIFAFFSLILLSTFFAYFETSRIKFLSSSLMYEPTRGVMKSDGSVCEVNDVSKVCVVGDLNKTPSISLIGDSHAQALIYSFDKILKERGLAANVYIMNGCPFIRAIKRVYYTRDCNLFVDQTISKISKETNKNVILLDNRNMYISGKNAYDEKQNKNLLVYPVDWDDWQKEGRVTEVVKLQRQTIMELLNLGLRVSFILPVPDAPRRVPAEVHKRVEKGNLPYKHSLENYINRAKNIFDLASQLSTNENFIAIYPHEIFCNSGECITHNADEIFYTDSNHLSIEGADLLLNAISDKIFRD